MRLAETSSNHSRYATASPHRNTSDSEPFCGWALIPYADITWLMQLSRQVILSLSGLTLRFPHLFPLLCSNFASKKTAVCNK